MGFDVAVDNALGVHMADCPEELLHVLTGIWLRQNLIVRTLDSLEQFTAVDILHDEVNLLLVLIGLIILHNIGVIKLDKILDLLSDLLHLMAKVLAFKHFYRYLVFFVVYILGQMHLAI